MNSLLMFKTKQQIKTKAWKKPFMDKLNQCNQRNKHGTSLVCIKTDILAMYLTLISLYDTNFLANHETCIKKALKTVTTEK